MDKHILFVHQYYSLPMANKFNWISVARQLESLHIITLALAIGTDGARKQWIQIPAFEPFP